MQFIVVNQVQKKNPSFSTKKIETLASQCVRLLVGRRVRNRDFLKRKELTIVLLSASEMKSINSKFRNKHKATDVLSFLSNTGSSLGEILLCPEVLVKQSVAHKVSLDSELTLMMTHGILHLLGYDHEVSNVDERLMKKHQDLVLNALNRS